jgi:hypothetical protein
LTIAIQKNRNLKTSQLLQTSGAATETTAFADHARFSIDNSRCEAPEERDQGEQAELHCLKLIYSNPFFSLKDANSRFVEAETPIGWRKKRENGTPRFRYSELSFF